MALTARCAKTVKRCWDAEKTRDSEIFVDLGVQPRVVCLNAPIFCDYVETRPGHAVIDPPGAVNELVIVTQ